MLLWTVFESGRRIMTKTGAGSLVFREEVAHSGGTRLEDGVLHLEQPHESRLSSVEIGDGVGNAEFAQVIVVNNWQLEKSDVGVNKDGLLRFAGSTADEAKVTITDLRESGAPLVKTWRGGASDPLAWTVRWPPR